MGSEKDFKLITQMFQLSQSALPISENMGNKLGHLGELGSDDKGKACTNGEDPEDPVVEVPPPMQPMALIPVATSASTNNLEQKVSNPFLILLSGYYFSVTHVSIK